MEPSFQVVFCNGIINIKAALECHRLQRQREDAKSARVLLQERPLTRHKATFNAPMGGDPLPLDLSSMGKGQSWTHRAQTLIVAHGTMSNCSRARTTTRSVTGLCLNGIVPMFCPVAVFSNILTQIFSIRSLKQLDISMNGLQGEIPGDGLGNLTQLVHLDMSLNRFNGSIPNQIF
ncbi:leucine-rich repeat-containing protein [Tanacetum coccineum]